MASKSEFSYASILVSPSSVARDISKMDNVTIFLPTNEAFTNTVQEYGCKKPTGPLDIIDCARKLSGRPFRERIIRNHVVAGRMDSEEVRRRRTFTSIGGDHIRNEDGLGLKGLSTRISRATFVDAVSDLEYDGGIVHAIDRILIPDESDN